jgi:hypothetical protein
MNREKILELVHRQQELEADILKIRNQFKNVKVSQLLKRLTQLSMSKDGVTAAGLGLPSDIVDKLEEYTTISATLRLAMNYILGDKQADNAKEVAADDVHE